MKRTLYGIVLIGAIALAGCGGGGGNGTPTVDQARRTEVAQTGSEAVKAVQQVMRLNSFTQQFAAQLGSARSQKPVSRQQSGQDPTTGLFYVVTSTGAGNGTVQFFQDAAHTVSAGTLTLALTQGANNGFPLTDTVTIDHVRAASGTIVTGTESVVINDPNAQSGSVNLNVSDNFGDSESFTLNFTGSNGQIQSVTGPFTVTSTVGNLSGHIAVDSSGNTTVTLPNLDAAGDSATISQSSATGPVTVTITDSNGVFLAREVVQPDGTAMITYADGTSANLGNIDSQNANQISG